MDKQTRDKMNAVFNEQKKLFYPGLPRVMNLKKRNCLSLKKR